MNNSKNVQKQNDPRPSETKSGVNVKTNIRAGGLSTVNGLKTING